MRNKIGLWRGIAAGGLALVLASGVGLSSTAMAAGSTGSEKTCKPGEGRQAMRAFREKMLTQAKAEDAVLEKLVAELNGAPEAKKPDIEATILTKLVAQHHEMVANWESLHAHIAQVRKEHLQASGMTAQNSPAAPK